MIRNKEIGTIGAEGKGEDVGGSWKGLEVNSTGAPGYVNQNEQDKEESLEKP